MADIGRNIDMIKTAEESEAAEEEAVEAVEVVEAKPEPKVEPVCIISEAEWFRFPRGVRKGWERLNDGTFKKR